MIAGAAYAADVFIMATYFLLARTGRALAFHWANALGAMPIAVTEVVLHAWAPLVLTVFFGCVGWYGVLRNTTRSEVARFALRAIGLGHLVDVP